MTVTREEIDAKLAASEARTETRFAEMNGKVDLMLSRMDTLASAVADSRQDSKEEARHTRQTLWAVAAIIVAIVGIATTVWLGGIDVGSKISELVDQKVAASRSGEVVSAPTPEAQPAPPQQ